MNTYMWSITGVGLSTVNTTVVSSVATTLVMLATYEP